MPNFANHPTAKTESVSGSGSQIPSKWESDQFRFHFINALQRSLNLTEVLNSFYQLLREVVPVAGMDYRHIEQSFTHSMGTARAHTCQYSLNYSGHKLGVLTLSRAKRFSDIELKWIEAAIGLLGAPLHNAILYREALQNSLCDSLTGVGNRAALEAALKREYILATRNHQVLSLIVADLDHFKMVNDRHGHSTGDRALQHMVKCAKQALRQTDQTFRYGGEEFVIILSNTNHDSAMLVAERVRIQLESTMLDIAGIKIPLTVSLGVATLKNDDTQETIFERADSAMYAAKQYGRNCCTSAEWPHVKNAQHQDITKVQSINL